MNYEFILIITVTFENNSIYKHRNLAMFPLVTPLLSKLTTILIRILNCKLTVYTPLQLVLFDKLVFLEVLI